QRKELGPSQLMAISAVGHREVPHRIPAGKGRHDQVAEVPERGGQMTGIEPLASRGAAERKHAEDTGEEYDQPRAPHRLPGDPHGLLIRASAYRDEPLGERMSHTPWGGDDRLGLHRRECPIDRPRPWSAPTNGDPHSP